MRSAYPHCCRASLTPFHHSLWLSSEMAAKSALVGEKASSMDSIPRDVTDSIFEVIKTWAEIDETEAKKEKGRK